MTLQKWGSKQALEKRKTSLSLMEVFNIAGDGSTGLMKVVFCYDLPTVVQRFGANETLHFRTATFWAQLLLGVGV
jgi:hypothetical protein